MWKHWITGDIWNSEADYIYYVIIQMNNRAEILKGIKRYYSQYK